MEHLPNIIPWSWVNEPFSSLSHLGMAPVFAVLMVFLIRKAWKRSHLIFNLVYGIAGVFLFSMSGIFHLLERGDIASDVFQRLDHAAIFFFTAASFTPIHGILFKGFARWGMLGIIWTTATTGITIKSIFFHEISEWAGLVMYLGMGWAGLASGFLLIRKYGWRTSIPLGLGAVSYTVGALFDYFRWPTIVEGVLGPHGVFHIFVVMGVIFHFYFIWTISDRMWFERMKDKIREKSKKMMLSRDGQIKS